MATRAVHVNGGASTPGLNIKQACGNRWKFFKMEHKTSVCTSLKYICSHVRIGLEDDDSDLSLWFLHCNFPPHPRWSVPPSTPSFSPPPGLPDLHLLFLIYLWYHRPNGLSTFISFSSSSSPENPLFFLLQAQFPGIVLVILLVFDRLICAMFGLWRLSSLIFGGLSVLVYG